MTHFLYLSGPPPDLRRFPEIVAERALSGVGVRGAERLLSQHELEQTWELRGDGEIADDWCADAMEAMIFNGESFTETKIGQLLEAYVVNAKRITLSYADDSVEGSTFTSPQEFLRHVSAQLHDPSKDCVNARYVSL